MAEAESDTSKIYNSRWIFFKPLDFLRDNCNPKHKGDEIEDSQLYKSEDDVNDSSEQWDDSTIHLVSLATENGSRDNLKENSDEILDEGLSNDHNELSDHSHVSMVQINSLNGSRPPDRNLRKRTGDDLESVIAKLRRTKPEMKTQLKNNMGPRIDLTSCDPDMVFAHHVGLSLMNVKDAKMKDLVKLKIQQVLYETQYGPPSMQSVEVQAFPMANQ